VYETMRGDPGASVPCARAALARSRDGTENDLAGLDGLSFRLADLNIEGIVEETT
jgi:hypothetical protein